MLPPCCFTCGHLFADFHIPYETDISNIDNNPTFNEKKKSEEKSKLLDKYHVTKYCCRTRVLGYVKLVDIII